MVEKRSFLRVTDFEALQNPKRPKRPTWIKSYVTDLDDPIRLNLTLTVRGFLSDFEKLAATMANRVPDDVQFIARKLGTQPAVAGKALNTCLTHGFISRFAEDMNTFKKNDLRQKTDSLPVPLEGEGEEEIDTEGGSMGVTANLKGNGHDPTDKTEGERRAEIATTRGGSNARTRAKGPPFEEMLQACLAGQIRGSDWDGMHRILNEKFQITPTVKQCQTLERQIIDRSKE